jgi:hypothetical protein
MCVSHAPLRQQFALARLGSPPEVASGAVVALDRFFPAISRFEHKVVTSAPFGAMANS